jgi:hypothetical protein
LYWRRYQPCCRSLRYRCFSGVLNCCFPRARSGGTDPDFGYTAAAGTTNFTTCDNGWILLSSLAWGYEKCPIFFSTNDSISSLPCGCHHLLSAVECRERYAAISIVLVMGYVLGPWRLVMVCLNWRDCHTQLVPRSPSNARLEIWQ